MTTVAKKKPLGEACFEFWACSRCTYEQDWLSCNDCCCCCFGCDLPPSDIAYEEELHRRMDRSQPECQFRFRGVRVGVCCALAGIIILSVCISAGVMPNLFVTDVGGDNPLAPTDSFVQLLLWMGVVFGPIVAIAAVFQTIRFVRSYRAGIAKCVYHCPPECSGAWCGKCCSDESGTCFCGCWAHFAATIVPLVLCGPLTYGVCVLFGLIFVANGSHSTPWVGMAPFLGFLSACSSVVALFLLSRLATLLVWLANRWNRIRNPAPVSVAVVAPMPSIMSAATLPTPSAPAAQNEVAVAPTPHPHSPSMTPSADSVIPIADSVIPIADSVIEVHPTAPGGAPARACESAMPVLQPIWTSRGFDAVQIEGAPEIHMKRSS